MLPPISLSGRKTVRPQLCMGMVHVSQINSYIINDVLMSLWNVSVRMRATRIISAAMAHVTHHLQRIIVIVCLRQIRRWIYVRIHSPCAVDFTCLAYEELASLQPNRKSDTKKLVVVFMPSGRITFVFFSNCADKLTECIRMNKRNGSLSIYIYICGSLQWQKFAIWKTRNFNSFANSHFLFELVMTSETWKSSVTVVVSRALFWWTQFLLLTIAHTHHPIRPILLTKTGRRYVWVRARVKPNSIASSKWNKINIALPQPRFPFFWPIVLKIHFYHRPISNVNSFINCRDLFRIHHSRSFTLRAKREMSVSRLPHRMRWHKKKNNFHSDLAPGQMP